MRLEMRTWGAGPRTALLVHGFSDDADTWWRVGPAVADLGYTVLAPDLRGHGRSPWSHSYLLEDFAQDLVDTLDSPPDFALGHSLGAVALGLAAPRLRPRRSVYVDPPWLRARPTLALSATLPTTAAELPPTWTVEEMAVDLASNRRLDPRVADALTHALYTVEPLSPPPAQRPGTVVLVPELDPVLPTTAHAALEALGYTLITQPGVRHVLHRDDFDGFMLLLRAQLGSGEIAA